jgi:hypothetical protein
MDGAVVEEATVNYGGCDLAPQVTNKFRGERQATVIGHRHYPNSGKPKYYLLCTRLAWLLEKGCKQHAFSYVQPSGPSVEIVSN